MTSVNTTRVREYGLTDFLTGGGEKEVKRNDDNMIIKPLLYAQCYCYFYLVLAGR